MPSYHGIPRALSTIVDIDADPTGIRRRAAGPTIQVATGVVIANPIVGVGLGSGHPGLNEARKRATWRSVHNAFLEYAFDLGIPGVLLFLSLLFASFRSAGESNGSRARACSAVGRQRLRCRSAVLRS